MDIINNSYYILGLLLSKGKIQTNKISNNLDIILEIRFNKPSDHSLRSDNIHNNLIFNEVNKSMYDYVLPDIIKLWNIIKAIFPENDTYLEHIPEPSDEDDFSKKIVRWVIKDISKNNSFIKLFWGNFILSKPSDIDSLPTKILELQKKAMAKTINTLEKTNVKFFMLGISDAAAIIPGPESAAFGSDGTPRIQIEVDNPRWKLNIAMLVFLQEILSIPVLNINWPHPTIKGRKNPRVVLKHNHQFRAHLWSYKNLGFNLSIKKRAFESIIKEMSTKYSEKDISVKFHPANRKNNKYVTKGKYLELFPKVTGLTTNPFKCFEHYEDFSDLPVEIRGKHYAEWRDVNFDLGDPYLDDYTSNISKKNGK